MMVLLRPGVNIFPEVADHKWTVCHLIQSPNAISEIRHLGA